MRLRRGKKEVEVSKRGAKSRLEGGRGIRSPNKTRTTVWWFLQSPAAPILFITRDPCSASIAKLFVPVLMGYCTIIARYVAKWGIAQMCQRVKVGTNSGWVLHQFGGAVTSPRTYRATWGSHILSKIHKAQSQSNHLEMTTS